MRISAQAFRTLPSTVHVVDSRPVDYSTVLSDYVRTFNDPVKGELIWRLTRTNAVHLHGGRWFGVHYEMLVDAMRIESSHFGDGPTFGIMQDKASTWINLLFAARQAMIVDELLCVFEGVYLVPTAKLIAELQPLKHTS